MSERKLTKGEVQSEALVLHYEKLSKRGVEAVCRLLCGLDAADEEIGDLHKQVNHDQQLLTTMACDASEVRGDNIMLRSALTRLLDLYFSMSNAIDVGLANDLEDLGFLHK